MNRLALVVGTGFLALMLTACGEDKGTAKPAEGTTENAAVQPQGNGDNAAKNADVSKTATPEQGQ